MTNGNLLVLRPDRGNNVGRCEPVSIQLVRVQPDAHGILRSEHLDVAYALDAAELIYNVGVDVIGNIGS